MWDLDGGFASVVLIKKGIFIILFISLSCLFIIFSLDLEFNHSSADLDR